MRRRVERWTFAFLNSQSSQLFASAQKRIPGGVNSPVRAFRGLNRTPLIIESASGDTLTDIEGNQYIDYCLSWGALIHGHAHPQILKNVFQRMQKGTSFGCTTEIEGRLARKIMASLPSCERLRFVSLEFLSVAPSVRSMS